MLVMTEYRCHCSVCKHLTCSIAHFTKTNHPMHPLHRLHLFFPFALSPYTPSLLRSSRSLDYLLRYFLHGIEPTLDTIFAFTEHAHITTYFHHMLIPATFTFICSDLHSRVRCIPFLIMVDFL
ncbi:hypothetical protein PISMIDRAFT_485139 [Pisolithus microcarpus 441]|uniref:Uncharacterized protein n=1 Tax=Pisolithus microcarpus 441 TaxID=765257 RepID=A0A0C9YWU1_9AGAM|nr:hypothetical protein PISMIDRAFT_485139 [Pisolithus microcarpus 441]